MEGTDENRWTNIGIIGRARWRWQRRRRAAVRRTTRHRRGTSELGETCTRRFDCTTGSFASKTFASRRPTRRPTAAYRHGRLGRPRSDPTSDSSTNLARRRATASRPSACIGNSVRRRDYGLTATGKSCRRVQVGRRLLRAAGRRLSPELRRAGTTADDGGPGSPRIAAARPLRRAPRATSAETRRLHRRRRVDRRRRVPRRRAACSSTIPTAARAREHLGVHRRPVLVHGAVHGRTAIPALANACPDRTRASREFEHDLHRRRRRDDGRPCTAGCAMDADCAGKIPPGLAHACGTADAGGPELHLLPVDLLLRVHAATSTARPGNTCDSTTHLCKAAGCTADSDCVRSLHNPRASARRHLRRSLHERQRLQSPDDHLLERLLQGVGLHARTSIANAAPPHSFCVTTPARRRRTRSAITN